jgi:hypothetical protein
VIAVYVRGRNDQVFVQRAVTARVEKIGELPEPIAWWVICYGNDQSEVARFNASLVEGYVPSAE